MLPNRCWLGQAFSSQVPQGHVLKLDAVPESIGWRHGIENSESAEANL